MAAIGVVDNVITGYNMVFGSVDGGGGDGVLGYGEEGTRGFFNSPIQTILTLVLRRIEYNEGQWR